MKPQHADAPIPSTSFDETTKSNALHGKKLEQLSTGETLLGNIPLLQYKNGKWTTCTLSQLAQEHLTLVLNFYPGASSSKQIQRMKDHFVDDPEASFYNQWVARARLPGCGGQHEYLVKYGNQNALFVFLSTQSPMLIQEFADEQMTKGALNGNSTYIHVGPESLELLKSYVDTILFKTPKMDANNQYTLETEDKEYFARTTIFIVGGEIKRVMSYIPGPDGKPTNYQHEQVCLTVSALLQSTPPSTSAPQRSPM